MTSAPWVLGGVAVALGLLAAVATPSGRTTVRRLEAMMDDWTRKVIARVSAHEGRPDSVNRNLDGQGLSYGILQWTQKSGNLGVLLAKMAAADPTLFASAFGAAWSTLVDVTQRGSLEAVDGTALWQEPWVARFVAAGREPVFIDVQYALAAEGEHFRGAEAIANLLGVRTERAMALFFDRAVQQGPAGARRIAERLLGEIASSGHPLSTSDTLAAFGRLAADRFRRTTTPPSSQFSSESPHIQWKAVGSEWHAFTGAWDLYEDIRRRTERILADPDLSDTPIPKGVT